MWGLKIESRSVPVTVVSPHGHAFPQRTAVGLQGFRPDQEGHTKKESETAVQNDQRVHKRIQEAASATLFPVIVLCVVAILSE
jgi:hypothetical protein